MASERRFGSWYDDYRADEDDEDPERREAEARPSGHGVFERGEHRDFQHGSIGDLGRPYGGGRAAARPVMRAEPPPPRSRAPGEGFFSFEGQPPRFPMAGEPRSYGVTNFGIRPSRTSEPMPEPETSRGPYYGRGPKGYRRSDERVREDVCDAIAREGWVDASEVEVRVQAGEVTLSGTVRDREAKRRLERRVDAVPGVVDVRNELRFGQDELPALREVVRVPRFGS